MAFALALSDARTEVIHLAAIDGQTGSSGRHSTTRLTALLNRHYRKLLARVGRVGADHGRQAHAGTLGSAVAGETFISLDIPATAAEVVDIDVVDGDTQSALDPLAWDQRRAIAQMCPPRGTGWWALRSGPSVSGSTLTQGTLAIFPTRIAGLAYTLYTVKQWPGITSDTDVFLMHDSWDEWLINSVVMAITQRDTNKRTNWDTANAAWANADAILVAQARRLNRSGVIIPTAYPGAAL